MHHHRRKSGHASANSSSTDVRKSVTVSDPSKHRSSRPAPVTRRSTPVVAQKLGKSPRDREKEWEEERWWEDERESFPQFCMTCEKQFIPQDDRFLYCSETCRMYDQTNTSSSGSAYSNRRHHSTSNYPAYSSGHKEHRDIIPRASPSRPTSTYFSSPPTTPTATSTYHTSAISALRSLSISNRPPSPPSPTMSYHPNIWPFTSSSTRSAATSPSTSYNSRSGALTYSSTYDSSGQYGAGYAYGYGGNSAATDRPLPSRRPSGYSRPKSIELVTPMVGR